MMKSLEQFIEFQTISGLHQKQPRYLEECRRGANFLRTLFRQLGADARLVGPLIS